MQGQPAHCKEPHYDGQRLGSLDLLLQRGARFFTVENFQLNQPELVPSGHEDAQVDAQHQQQGDQHAAKKVEEDHVRHEDHVFKQALDQTRGAVLGGLRCYMPAHHGGQADDDGQNPANGNNALRPLTGHQAVIPGEKRNKRQKTAVEPRRAAASPIILDFSNMMLQSQSRLSAGSENLHGGGTKVKNRLW